MFNLLGTFSLHIYDRYLQIKCKMLLMTDPIIISKTFSKLKKSSPLSEAFLVPNLKLLVPGNSDGHDITRHDIAI